MGAMSEMSDGFVEMSDGVVIDPPRPGELLTLPDGRTVVVVGVPDAIFGAPEPPPAAPPEHVDSWWWSTAGEWVIAQTLRADADPAQHADDPRGATAPTDHVGPLDGLPYVYVTSPAHTTGCDDHKPTHPPAFP